MTTSILVLSLALYLPAVVLLHRWAQLRAERKAQRQVPTQGIALKAVFIALLVVLVELGAGCSLGKITMGWSVWGAIVVGCLGYCYWLLVCLTESGRRYMIADLVDQNPGITSEQIVGRYNRTQIVAARLHRLEHWDTLQRDGARYRSRPNLMLVASVLVRFWAQVLGFSWPKMFKKESSHS